MESLLKIIAISVIASVLALSVKGDRPELTFLILISAGIVAIFLLVGQVREVVVFFSEIASKSGISGGIFLSLLKMVGIGYLTEIAAETVADFGSQSLSAKITLAGKLCVFLLATPIFKALLTIVSDLL